MLDFLEFSTLYIEIGYIFSIKNRLLVADFSFAKLSRKKFFLV
ncbi:hypothetical protein HMPREF9383_0622 [Streptococcus sanguinis SK150]|uniref:Uncharacterized protein n=1 Tax=Streptococcus sanguinis SK150 TaxID=888811 RepID=F0IKH0_STRSA|nr:hypothetical protein HMPREF9383_0622 [Streptococcus sanguinis SK150]EGJ42410.1 hypothetical protein HMPREF9396_1917 [Streptococcus sanguinis SK1059]EGQ18546.1 hypothetical protein HMPREF8573_2163 [Streptococcus sanguinis ATCC 29667]EGQ25465.1 hypothetical protein HMPREF9387_0500 [Streptococcus sanguinis SK340]